MKEVINDTVGHAVEKYLARYVDKFGNIMTDTFELYRDNLRNQYQLHYKYRDVDGPQVQIFYGIPNDTKSELFKEKMDTIAAWLALSAGRRRKPGGIESVSGYAQAIGRTVRR